MALTKAERRLRASIAGAAGWANTTDRYSRTAHASRGHWQKFYDATDASLPPDVRAKLADSAHKAHMQRLAFKSMKARRLRREAAKKLAQARRLARQTEQLETAGGVE